MQCSVFFYCGHLSGPLECQHPILELDVLQVERLELFLDLAEDGLQPSLGLVRQDNFVVSRASPVFSKALYTERDLSEARSTARIMSRNTRRENGIKN
jgi:hypothetical protein